MASASNSTSGTRPAGDSRVGEAWEDMLLVGVVARTQGNRGEVIVNATTDFVDDRFAVGARLWWRAGAAPAEEVTIAAFRMHLGRPVVRFDGVGDITGAERFAGGELRISGAAVKDLPPHVYYHHDLVGCAVVTAGGQAVGTVTAVESDGGVRLVVDAGGDEVLIPFAQAFCQVDVAARRIVVTLPEGLLELNRQG